VARFHRPEDFVFAQSANHARNARCQSPAWMLLAWLVLPLMAAAQNSLNATISWDSSISTNLSAYKVCYGTSSRSVTNYPNVITVDASITSLQISELRPGTAYFAAIKSVDSSGHESTYSPEVYFVIPPPPVLVVTPWTDTYGNRYVEVSTRQAIPRAWELEYTLDLVDWYPYDSGYDSLVDERYVHTDWDFIPQLFFRVMIY
jgi:hypothetical protein